MLVTTLLSLAAVQAPACPTLNVGGGGSGGTATFYGNLDGGDAKVAPKYLWAVSAGTIKEGKDKSIVTVSVPTGTTVTATLEVGGYAGCSVSNSTTVTVE